MDKAEKIKTWLNEGFAMTEQEQIQYLANIYYLAHADGTFEVDEDYHLIDSNPGGCYSRYVW